MARSGERPLLHLVPHVTTPTGISIARHSHNRCWQTGPKGEETQKNHKEGWGRVVYHVQERRIASLHYHQTQYNTVTDRDTPGNATSSKATYTQGATCSAGDAPKSQKKQREREREIQSHKCAK